MKSRNLGNFVFNFVMIVFVISLLIACQKYRVKLQLVPLLIGVPTLMLFFVVVISELRGGTETLKVEGFRIRRFMILLCWLFAFFFSIFLFGFYVSLPIYFLLFFVIEGKIRFLRSLVLAFVFSFVISGFFHFVLKINLWPGIMMEILPKFIGGAVMPPV